MAVVRVGSCFRSSDPLLGSKGVCGVGCELNGLCVLTSSSGEKKEAKSFEEGMISWRGAGMPGIRGVVGAGVVFGLNLMVLGTGSECRWASEVVGVLLSAGGTG